MPDGLVLQKNQKEGVGVLVQLDGTLLVHSLRWEVGLREDLCKMFQAEASTCMTLACLRKGERTGV